MKGRYLEGPIQSGTWLDPSSVFEKIMQFATRLPPAEKRGAFRPLLHPTIGEQLCEAGGNGLGAHPTGLA